MPNSSIIDPATIQAYHETHFIIEGDTPMTLRVGERNEALAALHKEVGVGFSAFVTAWNPYSQKHDDDLNAGDRKHSRTNSPN